MDRFLDSGQLTDDLRDWPTGLGAPTVDANGALMGLRAKARSLGADETIDYRAEDFVTRINELTNGNGVDVAQ